MGFRRAAQIGEPLSLVLVRLKPSQASDVPGNTTLGTGDAARVLIRKLRSDDSLYLLSPNVFGIVLPNTSRTDMNRVVDRVTEGLIDVSGVSPSFSFDIQVVNYPDQVATASEIERKAADFADLKRSA